MNTLDHMTALREAMVDQLRYDMREIRSEAVAAAFLNVPRHVFTPDVPPELAYHPDTAVWPKHDADGNTTSTVSAAHIQAVMVEQADLAPGMRVLEIGSGGYNAALIAEIVGPEGEVTSVDIDPEIVDRARLCLDGAGYRRVRTVLADADGGLPTHAPYDRIIVTVRVWDIPPAWAAQLAPGGRIVLPLRVRGFTRSVALDRVDDGSSVLLRGGNPRLCSFVPMQGAGAHDEKVISIGGDAIRLRIEGEGEGEGEGDLRAVAEAISSGMRGPRSTTWTGVRFDHIPDLDLWLCLWLPRFGLLTATPQIVDEGLLSRAVRRGARTLVSPDGFAYRTTRPITDADVGETGDHEVGVLAWGPGASALAQTFTEVVHRWDSYRRAGGTGPTVEVHAAGAPITPSADVHVDQRVLPRSRSTVVLSWPRP